MLQQPYMVLAFLSRLEDKQYNWHDQAALCSLFENDTACPAAERLAKFSLQLEAKATHEEKENARLVCVGSLLAIPSSSHLCRIYGLLSNFRSIKPAGFKPRKNQLLQMQSV